MLPDNSGNISNLHECAMVICRFVWRLFYAEYLLLPLFR